MDTMKQNLTTDAAKNGTTASRAPSPPPNMGRAVPDIEAVQQQQGESADEWRKRCGIDKSQQIRIVKLAHMRYQHPDLETITTFMRDFGMHVAKKAEDKVWFRGYGPDQYVYYAQKGPKKFLGGAFEVETFGDLEKLLSPGGCNISIFLLKCGRASKISGASQITELSDAPGGGSMITLVDPEGYPVNLIHGSTPAEIGKLPEKMVVNTESEKPRKRQFQRFQPGPAAVHKLGHFGLCVTKFEDQVAWYTRNFNIVPTDFLYVEPEGQSRFNVAMFAHIDRGEDLVDHHSFFMSTNKTSHVHHCSFEVHDFDTQALGHQWLGAKGYTSVWGLGRHILGSQIFDYWWDTTGNMVEHYADGDLVNEKTPVGYGPAGDEGLAVWGPEVPSWFLS